MGNRNRNTALMLMAAGVYLLLGNLIDFITISALVLIWIGIQQIRSSEEKAGYIFLGIGCLLLLSGHLAVVISLVLIVLGYFYLKSQQTPPDHTYMQKQGIIESIKWDKDPWVLKNMSFWSIIGEFRLDLSLALIEQKESTIIMQGVVADVDIIVPEDMGLEIHSAVLFGQLQALNHKHAGFNNKMVWKSLNFESCEHRLRLELSFIAGDIDIKIM